MKEEMIDIVTENDQFVRKATRKEVREKALLHRVARVIITNDENKLLIQKRSKTKDVNPGVWDIGIAETVKTGGGYEQTAMRGLLEELGITGVSNIQLARSFIFKVRYASQNHNIFLKVYFLKYNGKLKLQEEEVEEIKFCTIDEIGLFLEKEKFSPTGRFVFEKYMELKK